MFAKNQALGQGALNLQIARAYLTAADPQIARRTWQDVMVEIPRLKTGSTLIRWQTAVRDRAFDSLRGVVLLETRAEHFLHALDREPGPRRGQLRATGRVPRRSSARVARWRLPCRATATAPSNLA